MKKKILCVVAAYFGLALLFNLIFPPVYIALAYPDFQVRSSYGYNGSWGGLFQGSDIGWHYLDYEMYDSENDISFSQNFELVWYFPFYRVNGMGRENYNSLLRTKNSQNEIMKMFSEEYAEPYGGFVYHAPANTYGMEIFLPPISSDKTKELNERVGKYVYEAYRPSAGKDEYIQYSIFVCMDEEVFREMKQGIENNPPTHFSITYGQPYANEIIDQVLGCESVRIMAANSFDEDKFNAPGDPDDDKYQSPENFDHLIFCIESEPNSYPNEGFALYGINK